MTGEVEVKLNRYLPHDGESHVAFGRVYAHCADCMASSVARFNARFAIVQTVPITLLDKQSGELVDLPKAVAGKGG